MANSSTISDKFITREDGRLLTKAMLFGFLIIVISSTPGEYSRYAFEQKLSRGMTMHDVRSAVGEPMSIEPEKRMINWHHYEAAEPFTETWKYPIFPRSMSCAAIEFQHGILVAVTFHWT